MTPAQHSLLASATSRFGTGIAVRDADLIAPWLTDWRGRFHGAAPAILQPATTAEAAALVTLSREHGVPLVAQGGNTSMVAGATPPADGSALLFSTRRMRAVRRIDAGVAVAEAGVILSELHDAAAAVGARFPLTLGARGSATIGGLVSTNAGGTQVLRWGTMRALTLGVEAVLPDGSVHDGLAGLVKDNRGYDLSGLLVGAEGTLGIVTAATLRLVPAVAARGVAWAGVATPGAAAALLARVRAATDAVESFEIVPGDSLALVLRHIPGTRAPLAGEYPWHVLVEVAGPGEGRWATEVLEAVLGGALADGLVADATIAASETQADALWTLRDSLSAAERANGPAVQHDIAVPPGAMPDFMTETAAAMEAAFPGTRATAFGHLGDGNVHFHVAAPPGVAADAWYADSAPAIVRAVHDRVAAAGGTISAEHGIGRMKRDELARLGPPARLAAMRAIKAALDPDGRMNPGALLPTD